MAEERTILQLYYASLQKSKENQMFTEGSVKSSGSLKVSFIKGSNTIVIGGPQAVFLLLAQGPEDFARSLKVSMVGVGSKSNQVNLPVPMV